MAGREDPLVGFHFGVEVQDVLADLYFTECSGLGSEHEVIEQKLVGDKGTEIVYKIPGRLKWENITLKRGITSKIDIWEWRKKIEEGQVDDNRHDGSVTMYNQNRDPVARWEFKRAWPSKVTGPQPKADSNELGIEELTITHEYIERVEI